ncbi:MAG TPA: hypothetical protein VM008_07610 [Phycisphaerae bacterium]|nr:hypothetical protein [Phycisphaerae bacterium]
MNFQTTRREFNVDGAAYLFNCRASAYRLVAVSTTGCVAVQVNDDDVRVFYWWYRSTGKEPIVIEPVPWIRIWSCASPKNRQPAGYLTRLHCDGCELTDLHVDSLRQLAHLRCRHNHLQRLICSGMACLRTLECAGNALTSLEIANCGKLERLNIGGNPAMRATADELLAIAHGEDRPRLRRRLTATSLFDL